jgi:hypothetical protein
MKIFATRVWGFDPAYWPVITFGLEGNRDRLLKQSQVGDCIVFVGTQNAPTHESERGRLLGIAQIGRIATDTLSVVPQSVLHPHDYDEYGNFRWPKALAMTRAWAFNEKPLLKDVLSKQLPFNATAQAVLLSDEDAERIKNLRAAEIVIPSSHTIEKLQKLEMALSNGKPTKGVIPSAWNSNVTRTLGNPSVTYAMRYGTTDCWKIGHTTNTQQRLNEVKKHIPHEITNAQWALYLTQKWADENMAYAMEQKLFSLLEKQRTEGERVRCSEALLMESWARAVL